MPSDLELLALQAETLFVHTAGKLLYINEPERPEAPRFFLGRTREGNLYRFRHDLPEDIVTRLEHYARIEPSPQNLHDPTQELAAFQSILDKLHPVEKLWSGPAFRFPEEIAWPTGVVPVTEANQDILQGEFAWLRACLPAKQPCAAVVEDGRAVSVCHSSRTSQRAAEAGLETLSTHRGRGYAAATTQAWAILVRRVGRVPLYSTSWDNLASQGVARKLGLILYGADFHLT
jgi:hypothetical protein